MRPFFNSRNLAAALNLFSDARLFAAGKEMTPAARPTCEVPVKK
jgi:hypothetical protein